VRLFWEFKTKGLAPVKESTRRSQRRQARARQWAEIVALHAAQVGVSATARRCGCCRQTVYNVLAKAQGLPPGQAPAGTARDALGAATAAGAGPCAA